MDLLLEVLPVEDVGHPGERIGSVEDNGGELPRPGEGIDEEDVEGKGDGAVVHAVGVFQINSAVFDVVAGVEK